MVLNHSIAAGNVEHSVQTDNDLKRWALKLYLMYFRVF